MKLLSHSDCKLKFFEIQLIFRFIAIVNWFSHKKKYYIHLKKTVLPSHSRGLISASLPLTHAHDSIEWWRAENYYIAINFRANHN